MSTALMPGFVDEADNLYKISRGRDSTGEDNLCSLLGRGSSMQQNHHQQQQNRHQQQQRRHSSALPSFFPPSRFSVSGGNGGGVGGGAIGTAPTAHRDDRFRERSLSESGERHQAIGNNINNNNVSNNNNNNSSRYKTELCRPFQESGACKYGDKCQFAHGLHELRALVRHPKYKTELCRTFHTIGFCPYGPRCHFIHNADEKRVADPPRLAQKLQRSLSSSGALCGVPMTSGGIVLDSCPFDTPVSPSTTLALFPDPFGFGPFPLLSQHHRSLDITTSPAGSLSDPDAYGSSPDSPDSLSDSDSPEMGRRLPIFSRLSISDD
uniref:mRNA decay activator protein ZFP36L2-A-like n=1 Tax=Myxine glutinosa TaxID=7769 RepID=UPI00358F0FEB